MSQGLLPPAGLFEEQPGGGASAADLTPRRQAPDGEALRPPQPWATVEESTREVKVRKLIRGLLATAAVLLMLLGLRSLFVPAGQPAAQPTTSVIQYPRQEAGAVASRFVANYLTTSKDAAAATARQSAIAADLAAGARVDLTMTGEQSVQSVQAAGVVTDGEDVHQPARVTVLALLTAGTGRSWVAMDVPVGYDGHRIVVTAAPAFVALPKPGAAAVPTGVAPESDPDLTARTQAGVAATFKAMAGHDGAALAQVSAPGSQLAPLGDAVAFKGLESWSVAQGGQGGRTGRAVVVWATSAGEVRQTYQVTLSAVTTTTTTDWRVSAVTVDPTAGQ